MTQARPAPYWNNRIKRSEVWSPRKQQDRVEEGFYPTFEDTIRLFGGWPWHMTIAQRSQPGRPDYAVYFEETKTMPGWYAEVELKARNPITGRIGKLTVEQTAWGERSKRSGVEWHCFLLPDEWPEIDAWLEERTGKHIRIPR